MPAKKYSDEDIRRMREDWATGEFSIPDLAMKYNIPRKKVPQFLIGKARPNAGGPIFESAYMRPGIEEKIAKMFVDHTENEICAELKISTGYLYKIKNKFGLNRTVKFASGKTYNAKLTESDVRKIRILHSTGGYPIRSLAGIFQCTTSSIHHVIKRKTFKYVL